MEVYIAIMLLVAPLTSGEDTQCQEISIPMCKGIGYNYTHMPNEFNQDSQVEAGLEVHQFFPLVQIQCSSDLKLFLCSMYAPICIENYKQRIPPCRSVCKRVKSGCAPIMRKFGFEWPERLDCSKLPNFDEKGKICMDPHITDSPSTERPSGQASR